MDVLVAGAHGGVGIQLAELLAESDHRVTGMVRNEDQLPDIEALGAESVLGDLTVDEDVARAIAGQDAIVFAAGSGGDDVYGVDRDGANAMVDAAASEGIERFVMLSAMNADAPDDSPDGLAEYLDAKAQADAYLRESALTETIVRPGALTDDPATGRVTIAEKLTERGEITRADVARVLLTTLDIGVTFGQTFELLGGDVPIETALETLPTA
jgi:uncharacterized protein YbjT (DUF2867 family)